MKVKDKAHSLVKANVSQNHVQTSLCLFCRMYTVKGKCEQVQLQETLLESLMEC